MERPNKHEKTVNPYSKDIAETARVLIEEGTPFTIQIRVADDIFKQHRKQEIVEILRSYGAIIRNPNWSRYITLKPHNMNDIERLEEDYYNDKFVGIKALELDPEIAVYCGRRLNDYLF